MRRILILSLLVISVAAQGQYRRYSSIPSGASGPATWAPLEIKTVQGQNLKGAGNITLNDFLKRNDSTLVGQSGYGIAGENPLNNATAVEVQDSSNAVAGWMAIDRDPSIAVPDSVFNGVVNTLYDDGFGTIIKDRKAVLSGRSATGDYSQVYATIGTTGMSTTNGTTGDFGAVITNSSAVNIYYNVVGSNGVLLSLDDTGIKVTDSRTIKTGIVNSADYSGTFVNESLITKRYADSKVATTVTDGVLTSAPNQNAVHDFVTAAVAAGDATFTSGKKVRIFTRALNEVLGSTSGSMGAAVFASEIADGESVTIKVTWAAKDDNTNTGAGGLFISTWTKASGTLQKVHDNNLGTSTSDTGDALALSTSDVSGDITVSIGTGTVGGNFSASAIAEVVIRKP